jgi:TolA-binding protein
MVTPDWVIAGTSIFGLIGIGATAVAYFTSSYSKTTNQLLKEENDALSKVNFQLKSERDELAKQVANLQGQINTLTALVTQRSDVETLKSETLLQHKEVIEALTHIAELLAQQMKVIHDTN